MNEKQAKLLKKLAIGLLLALPLLFCLVLVKKYAVNVPFGDEWVLPKLFREVDHNKISSLGELWHQHNEHRILFPKLVMAAVAYSTHWNITAQIYVNVLVSVLIAALLLKFIRTTIKNKALSVTLMFLTLCWFFSPVQWENWIWGWQITWYLSILALTTSITLLGKYHAPNSRKRRIIAAILCAIIASYSLGSGIIVWPVGLVLLFINRASLKAKLVWVGSGVATVALYYLGYVKPADTPSQSYFLKHLLDTTRYFLGFFGRPISDHPETAVVVGSLILSLLACLAVLINKNYKKILLQTNVFIGLLTYCLIASVFITISRVGFGWGQGLSSRYTAVSLLVIIALLGIIAVLVDNKKSKKTANLAVALLLIINTPLIIASYINGMAGLRTRSAYMSLVKSCTSQETVSQECAAQAFPGSAGIVKAEVPYAKTKHWGGY